MKVITTNLLNRFWKNGIIPIKKALGTKVNTADIVNNFTTTVANKVADARALKTLMDEIAALNRNIESTNTKLDKFALTNVESINFGYDGKNAFTIDFNLTNGQVAKLVVENTGLRYLYSDGTTWTTIWSK